jgi:hypothetical protein
MHLLQDELSALDRVLKSSEREKVLADLQSALHLIQDYQRSLSIVCAADPHYIKADTLLDKYGLQADSHKIVAGFQATPHKPTIIGIDHQGHAATLMAERTNDGDRLFFVSKDEGDPPALASAKAVTEDAGFPEPDTID